MTSAKGFFFCKIENKEQMASSYADEPGMIVHGGNADKEISERRMGGSTVGVMPATDSFWKLRGRTLFDKSCRLGDCGGLSVIATAVAEFAL